MPYDDVLCSWLVRSALASLAILLIGSAAVLVWRQPVRRVRIIELVLAGCLITPWLGMIPGYPQLAVVWWHTAAINQQEAPLPPSAEQMIEPTILEPMPFPTSDLGTEPVPSTETIEAAPLQAASPPPAHVFGIRSGIIAVYLIGVAVGVGWWLVGIAGLARLLWASQPAPSRCRELLTKISGGRGDRVRLLVSRRLNQPFASAWGRAVIVLPENLCGDAQALRWCLAHEWAHVDQHDFRTWLLAGLAKVLFFYQPLLWWLRRQLRLCQDFVADSQAARQAPQVEDYAEFLTTHAAAGSLHPAVVGLSMGCRTSELYRRIIMLLKNQPLESRAPRLWTTSVTVATLVLVALVAAVSLVPRAVAEEKPAISQAAAAKPADEVLPSTPQPAKNTRDQSPKTTEIPDDTWYLGICLDVPSTEPEAVQGAVFDKDPVPLFLAGAKRWPNMVPAQGVNYADAKENFMAQEWNRVFKGVTGDKVWVLRKNLPGESGPNWVEVGSKPFWPAGKKWIVTKAVYFKGKPVWWCIPIEVKGGQVRYATLSEGNRFDWRTVFDNEDAHQSSENSAAKPSRDRFSTEERVNVESTPAPGRQVVAEMNPEQAKAIAAIRDLGGSVNVREESPGKTWIGVLCGRRQQVADARFEHLIEHLKGLTNLKSLTLEQTTVSDTGLKHLKELTQLQSLRLGATNVTDAGLEHLNGLTNLQSLALVGTQVTDAGLANLRGLTKLQSLTLRGTKFTNAGLEHLKGFTKLQRLTLWETRVTCAGLASLRGLAKLETLSLSGPMVTDARLEHLKGLPALLRLFLTQTQVTDAGLVHIEGLSRLQSLSLWEPNVTDAGLANLKGVTQLHYLELMNTQVTGAGLVHLNGLSQLQGLSLSGTEVTGAGLEHLKGLASLHDLVLAGTGVTDAGLVHLKDVTQLQRLILARTQVTDAGLEHLKGLVNLRELNLTGTKVTDAGVKRLQETLPHLKRIVTTPSSPPAGSGQSIPAVQQPQEGKQHPQSRYTATKTIAGVVVDEADRPVSDAHVWFEPYPGSEKTTAHTRSDKEGRFLLEVTWHEGMFSADWPTMWAFAPGHSLSAASAREALAAGKGGPKVRIVLRAQRHREFLVLAPDGACLAGASVAPYYHSLSTGPMGFLVPKEVRQAVAATTGRDGRVSLPGLPEHGSSVLVTSKYGSTEVHLRFLDSYEPAEPKTTIRLRRAGRVEGRLIADDPKLVRGVRISLSTGEPRPPIAAIPHGFGRAEVFSDKDGRFVVPAIAEGRLCLRVRIDERLPYRAIVPEGLTVGNPAPTRVEIRIVPAVRIRGQVREKASGRPVAGITLFVLYVKGRESLASEGLSPVFVPHETATSDKQGKFTAFVLPGDVELQMFPYPGGWSPLPEATLERYSVPAGVVRFDLPPVEVVRSQRAEK